MGKIFGRVIYLVECWATLLLALMVVLVCLGVIFRYALDSALAWYDEFASYLLVWLTFYGAVPASYYQRHIRFETVMDRLMPATKRRWEIVAEGFVMVFQAVLFYYGWQLTRKMGDETAVSLVWVKMGWVYSVLPITGALMLLISVQRLCALIGAGQLRKGAPLAWSGSSSE